MVKNVDDYKKTLEEIRGYAIDMCMELRKDVSLHEVYFTAGRINRLTRYLQSDEKNPLNKLIEECNKWSEDFESPNPNEDWKKRHNKTVEFLYEEVKETEQAILNNDFKEILDGYADVAFIAINGIYKLLRNLNHPDFAAERLTKIVLKEVIDSNNSKRQNDGTVLKKNGKVQKGENYFKPDLAKYAKRV